MSGGGRQPANSTAPAVGGPNPYQASLLREQSSVFSSFTSTLHLGLATTSSPHQTPSYSPGKSFPPLGIPIGAILTSSYLLLPSPRTLFVTSFCLRVWCQRSAVRRVQLPCFAFLSIRANSPQLPSFKALQSPTTTIISYPGKFARSIRAMRSRSSIFLHHFSPSPPSTAILPTCPVASFTSPHTICANLPTTRHAASILSITL